MSAIYRIEKRKPQLEGLEDNDAVSGFKEYLGRLLRMIPGEIVGLYMIGSGFIPATRPTLQIVWPCICLVLLFVLRIWGTADPAANKPSQPIPVGIAAGAFVIWIYWLGGPFVSWHMHDTVIASLLVLVWSFIIPIFYKGE